LLFNSILYSIKNDAFRVLEKRPIVEDRLKNTGCTYI